MASTKSAGDAETFIASPGSSSSVPSSSASTALPSRKLSVEPGDSNKRKRELSIGPVRKRRMSGSQFSLIGIGGDDIINLCSDSD